jgi:hypothetical protein
MSRRELQCCFSDSTYTFGDYRSTSILDLFAFLAQDRQLSIAVQDLAGRFTFIRCCLVIIMLVVNHIRRPRLMSKVNCKFGSNQSQTVFSHTCGPYAGTCGYRCGFSYCQDASTTLQSETIESKAERNANLMRAAITDISAIVESTWGVQMKRLSGRSCRLGHEYRALYRRLQSSHRLTYGCGDYALCATTFGAVHSS